MTSAETVAHHQQQDSMNNNHHANATAAVPEKKSSTAADAKRIDPQLIGWTFVQNYYTVLSKEPEKLHCFFSKNSYMLRGTEGEMVETCHGQQEIQEAVKQWNLYNAKVIISNVDSQSSLHGSILVTVLGELDVNGSGARKFNQTFVLAEQPAGYYVYNDVFRYLKEPDYDVVEDEVPHEVSVLSSSKDEKVEPSALSPSAVPVGSPVKKPLAPQQVQQAPASTMSQWVEPVKPIVAEVKEPVRAPSQPPKEKPVPASAPVPKAAPEQASPSTVKTWATLAADSAKDAWSKRVVEAPPKSEEAPEKVAAKKEEAAEKPQQQQNVGLEVFIRGFSKATTIPHIKDHFARAVGQVRWVELLSGSSAFVEFANTSEAKKALDLKTITINNEVVVIEFKPRTQQQQQSARFAQRGYRRNEDGKRNAQSTPSTSSPASSTSTTNKGKGKNNKSTESKGRPE